jgi:hypothetical protein
MNRRHPNAFRDLSAHRRSWAVTAGFAARPRGNTGGWSRYAIASLSHQGRGMADGVYPRKRFSLLGRENKRHVLFVVQSLAGYAIHTTYGRRHPLMVCRHKDYGFALHPILVRHPNHAVLECDQVRDLAFRRERLTELGRWRRRTAIHYDHCRWSLYRWIHHRHIPLAASAGRQHAAHKTTYKQSHKTPFSMGLALLRGQNVLRRTSGPPLLKRMIPSHCRVTTRGVTLS